MKKSVSLPTVLTFQGEYHARILRSIVDYAIITLDADGIITSWSEGAKNVLGWSEEDAIGRSVEIFFLPDDVAQNRPQAEMRKARDDGRSGDERWLMRKDGSRFWASGLMMPLLFPAGDEKQPREASSSTPGFVLILRDRTAHEKARVRKASLEQRAALVMKRAGTFGVYELDVAQNILSADPIAAGLHGMRTEAANVGTSVSRFFEGIHPDDQPMVRSDIERAVRDEVDVDVTYRTFGETPRPRWVHSQATLLRDAEGCVAKLSGIVMDITEQLDAAQMQEKQLQFLDTVRDIKDPDDIARLASRTIAETLYASRAGHGYMEADGATLNIRADWNAEGSTSIVGRHRFSDFGRFTLAVTKGETVVIEDIEDDPQVDDPSRLAGFQVRSLVNVPLMEIGRLRAVLFVTDIRPRVWSDVELRFMRSIFDRAFVEIERLRSRAERDVLVSEMAHRMKNMIMMAQVVVTQTLSGTDDMASARVAIVARLHALSKAQDVLTGVDHQDASILDVVTSALKPHLTGDDRIRFSGPNIVLTAQQVLGLSLALHELATNAAKYGALSNDVGRVDIGWTHDDGKFSFTWSEAEGPKVVAPSSHGFGSKILDQVVGGYFEGAAEVCYAPHGLRFVLNGTL